MTKKPQIYAINPPIEDFHFIGGWTMPIGLLSVLGILRRAGANCTLLDCTYQEEPLYKKAHGITTPKYAKHGFYKTDYTILKKPEIFKDINQPYKLFGIPYEAIEEHIKQLTGIDAFLVTATITYHYQSAYKVIDIIKKHHKNTPVIIGGIFPTLCHEHAQHHSGANFICTGPGEEWIQNILTNNLNMNLIRQPTDNYDDIPHPSIDFYTERGVEVKSAPIMTSRGCRFKCPNCASSLTAPYARRSPEKIIKKIEEFYDQGLRNLIFYDDSLLTDAENYFDIIFYNLMGRYKKLFYHVPNALHCRYITPERAKLLVGNNFRKIRLALETVNSARMNELGKLTIEDFNNSVKNLVTAGANRRDISAYIMVGQPDQDLEDMVKSIVHCLRHGISATPLLYSLIPGTRDFTTYHGEAYNLKTYEPLTGNREYFPALVPEIKRGEVKQIMRLAGIMRELYESGVHLFDGTRVNQMFIEELGK